MSKRKNNGGFGLVAVLVFVIVAAGWLARDLYLRRNGPFNCGDGPRRRIDIRDFTTQYSAYSVELEAKVKEASVSAKLTPVQLRQISDANQLNRDFMQYVVAGYNSCAISKLDYGRFENRFRALDSMAKEIDQVLSGTNSSRSEEDRVGDLIRQYTDLVRKAGSD